MQSSGNTWPYGAQFTTGYSTPTTTFPTPSASPANSTVPFASPNSQSSPQAAAHGQMYWRNQAMAAPPYTWQQQQLRFGYISQSPQPQYSPHAAPQQFNHTPQTQQQQIQQQSSGPQYYPPQTQPSTAQHNSSYSQQQPQQYQQQPQSQQPTQQQPQQQPQQYQQQPQQQPQQYQQQPQPQQPTQKPIQQPQQYQPQPQQPTQQQPIQQPQQYQPQPQQPTHQQPQQYRQHAQQTNTFPASQAQPTSSVPSMRAAQPQPFSIIPAFIQNISTKTDTPAKPASLNDLGQVGGLSRNSITIPDTDSGSKDQTEPDDGDGSAEHLISADHISFRASVLKLGFEAAGRKLTDSGKQLSLLGKTGSQGATFLHIALDPKAFDRKLFGVIKHVMDEYPTLYKNTSRDPKKVTIVHVALLKSKTKQGAYLNPTRINWLMQNYPKQVADILKTSNSHPLLSDFMPVFLSAPQEELLSHLLGAPGSPKNDDWEPITDGKSGITLLHLAAAYTPDEQQAETGQNHGVAATEPSESRSSKVQTSSGSVSQSVAATDDPKQGTNIEWQLKVVQRIYELWPKALTVGPEGDKIRDRYRSPYQHRRRMFNKKTDTTMQNDKVCNFLKDQLMHLPDSENIIRQLGSEEEDLEIQLDLSEIRKMQTTEQVQALVKQLKLQNILQYVVIPGTLFLSEDKAARAASAENDDGQGIARKAFKKIFEALEEKKVTKIIKLVVEDDEEVSHSDEVLEGLKAFEIEEWDWKRVDICSQVLLRAAPKVQKLKLYSNGNPAVLHSWSGSDGLNLFPELKQVHVQINWLLESKARTQQYVETFKKRLASSFGTRKIAITVSDIQKARSHESSSIESNSVQHMAPGAWLAALDKFTGIIRNYPTEDEDPEGLYTLRGDREVRVAIIDDGYDGIDPDLSVAGGKSFYVQHPEKRIYPYYCSSAGHGTLMAKLVKRVCPLAKLYVARLDQGEGLRGEIQPTAESAAKAIRWAINKNVQIISMSWTIYLETKNPENDSLKAAINEASNENILMFGSAADRGLNDGDAYPGPAMPQKVFCIGAAKESGAPEDWSDRGAIFVLPGSDSGIGLPDGKGGFKRDPGSSFATALASGLAALILLCVELSAHREKRKLMSNFASMHKLFKQMALKTNDSAAEKERKYIDVSRFFKDEFSDESWPLSPEGSRKFNSMVGDLCREAGVE